MPAITSRLPYFLLAAALLAPALANAASPFAGQWNGTWTDAESGQSGEAAVVIDPDGKVDGTVQNGTVGETGPLRGTVTDDGTALLRYTYDQGRTTYRASGTFRMDDGGLAGQVDFTAPNGMHIGRGVFRFTLVAAKSGGGKTRRPVPDK